MVMVTVMTSRQPVTPHTSASVSTVSALAEGSWGSEGVVLRWPAALAVAKADTGPWVFLGVLGALVAW